MMMVTNSKMYKIKNHQNFYSRLIKISDAVNTCAIYEKLWKHFKKECVVLSFLLQTIIIISSSSYCSSSCTITITCLCFLLPSDFLFLRNLSQHVLSNLKYHNKYIFEPMTLSKCVCVQHPHGVSLPLDQCVLSLRQALNVTLTHNAISIAHRVSKKCPRYLTLF